MKTAQERLEPPRLQRMEHFGGESVCETPADCRIVEASIEEDMEWDLYWYTMWYCGLPFEEAKEVHWCKWWSFWIISVVVIIVVFWYKIRLKMQEKYKK